MKVIQFRYLLMLLFILFGKKAECQLISLDDLLSMRTTSLPELQIMMLEKDYYLLQIDRNTSKRVDSVVFIKRDEDYSLTFNIKKKSEDNSITLAHYNDASFLNFSKELKNDKYRLLHTELVPPKGIYSYYLCKDKGIVLLTSVNHEKQGDISSLNRHRQQYRFSILSARESQQILRKYRSK